MIFEQPQFHNIEFFEIINKKGWLKKSDVDLLQKIARNLDDNAKMSFFLGSIKCIVDNMGIVAGNIKNIINSMGYINFNKMFGVFLNVFDIIGGYAIAYAKYKTLDDVKYRKKFQEAFIGTNIVMSTQLLGATTATLLGQYLLQGLAAAVCIPIAGFGFAIAAWSNVGFSAVSLDRAIKKTDPAYLIEDKIKKYYSIMKKIAKLQMQLESESIVGKASYTILDRIGKFEAAKDNIKTEMTCFAKIYTHQFNEIKTKYPEFLNDANIKQEDINQSPKNSEIQFVQHLQVMQQRKVALKCIGCASAILTAIGMTLIAFAPFFPPLMIPGITFTAAAGGIKLAELIVPKIQNWFYKKEAVNTLLRDYTNDKELDDVPKEYTHLVQTKKPKHIFEILENLFEKKESEKISENDRKRFKIAYETLKKSNSHLVEKDFYAQLLALPHQQRKKILKGAFNEYMENEILKKALGSKYNDLNLSEKHKHKIIENYIFISKTPEKKSANIQMASLQKRFDY